MKSLLDIAKNNELPTKVTYSTGTVYVLLCIGDNNIACTHTERTPDKIVRQTSDLKQWELWTEPKPIPHYQAVIRYAKGYEISKLLYPTEAAALSNIGCKFVRLLTEQDAIMLVPQ